MSVIDILKPGRIFSLLRGSLSEFHQNEPLRMAAATAFFTTFALPPILIILIQVFGLFLDPRNFTLHLFDQLGSVLGKNTVLQIRQTLRNVRRLSSSWYITTAGFIFLIFVATTLFTVIKDSLNQLWKIQLKEKKSFIFILEYRLKSFAVIMMSGILFLGILMAEGSGALLREHANDLWPGLGRFLTSFINQVMSVLVVVAWFSVIFKYLSDGRPTWKVAIAGGCFTGLLFTVGKLVLKWLLTFSNMHTIYGASTSFVLLLLFVFYSSLIFYFGACFTKVFGEYSNQPILPTRHAIRYTLNRVKIDGNEKIRNSQ
jgi:membrane protein